MLDSRQQQQEEEVEGSRGRGRRQVEEIKRGWRVGGSRGEGENGGGGGGVEKSYKTGVETNVR